ncbi:MAG TPA: DUF6438 domain-containing protein [Steroidobacteraceae bacterium]|nr:DUF6438 domain-containing protein [Steroidobacteraceae bacterium]
MRNSFVAVIVALSFVGAAYADKPVDKPYAASAPFGGIPLWEPGDKFVGISSGTCSGSCPVYELYVFEDGRVVFSGRKDTAKTGIWKKQVSPDAYAELVTMIVRTKVLDDEIKRKTCLKGRPVLTVLRSASESGNARSVLLNSGCEGYADLVKEIESAFIQWADVAKWL